MKNLDTIKKELKRIQANFNPQKSTYKIIEELTTKNYNIDQMINILSKIRGINRYPNEIKEKFFNILDDLKSVKQKEINEAEEKRRLLEKQKQEANTKELKDIIDTLEKKLNKPKKEKKPENIAKPTPQENSKDLKPIDKEKPKTTTDKNPKTIFKILLISVIITLIIILLLLFFY